MGKNAHYNTHNSRQPLCRCRHAGGFLLPDNHKRDACDSKSFLLLDNHKRDPYAAAAKRLAGGFLLPGNHKRDACDSKGERLTIAKIFYYSTITSETLAIAKIFYYPDIVAASVSLVAFYYSQTLSAYNKYGHDASCPYL